jgi:hypothetical protein
MQRISECLRSKMLLVMTNRADQRLFVLLAVDHCGRDYELGERQSIVIREEQVLPVASRTAKVNNVTIDATAK